MILQNGFHGCSLNQHREQLDQHMSTVKDHHSLNEIFNDNEFPSILNLPGMISDEQLSEQPTPTPEQWKSIFCGISSHQSHPMNVCLHKGPQEELQEEGQEEPQGQGQAKIRFDIDSFLGFASSLVVAKQGLWYQPAPQMKHNISTDVHLKSQVFRKGEDEEQASLAMLKDIPHFLIWRFIFFERFYMDLGKEIYPNIKSLLAHIKPEDENLGAGVYSWKRCCLEKYLSWM